MNYRDQIKTIEARMAEIRGLVNDATGEELKKLDDESTQLAEQRAELVKKMEIAERSAFAALAEPLKPIEAPNASEERGLKLLDKKSVTYDARSLIRPHEARDLVVGQSNLVLPQFQATTINPDFNQISTLIDNVAIMNLPGGESYKQPYATGHGTADYTAMGTAYSDVETTFDYAEINKTKITAYEESPEEITKLAAAPYDQEIQAGISKAIRRKITREILLGDGAAGHFVGIFEKGANAPKAIDPATDKALTAIDEFTLDEIIYAYGGEEDVEAIQALVMNKADLLTFAKIRDTNGNKIYAITNYGNAGTINGIPFILNSACKAMSASATASGDYCMLYGNLKNYQMAVFSPIEVKRSTDYKFKEGMIAHAGVVFAGGNVVSKNGFLRIKKG